MGNYIEHNDDLFLNSIFPIARTRGGDQGCARGFTRDEKCFKLRAFPNNSD